MIEEKHEITDVPGKDRAEIHARVRTRILSEDLVRVDCHWAERKALAGSRGYA